MGKHKTCYSEAVSITVATNVMPSPSPTPRRVHHPTDKSSQLGICTADGALGLTAAENVHAFFANPATHCVGYGAMLTNCETAAVAGGDFRASDETIDAATEDGDTTPREAVSRVVASEIGEADEEATAGAVELTPLLETLPDSLTESSCPELLVRTITSHETAVRETWVGLSDEH